MERELWKVVYTRLKWVARRFHQKYVHLQPWRVAAVLLWAAAHDRPVSWACDKRNWATTRLRPGRLPSEATISRGAKRTGFHLLLNAVAARLRGDGPPAWELLVDGKPLVVGGCSKDPDARRGRGAGGGFARGYKLHAIWGDRCLPEAWEVTGLNEYEGAVAERLLARVRGVGLLLADGNYEASRVYDAADASGYQLLAPPDPQDTGAGHRYPESAPAPRPAVVRRRAGVAVAPGPGGDRAGVRERRVVRRRAGPAAELGPAAGPGEPVGVVQAGPQCCPHPPTPGTDVTFEIRWEAPGLPRRVAARGGFRYT